MNLYAIARSLEELKLNLIKERTAFLEAMAEKDATCACMRKRLEELLQVCDLIDNEEQHQTKATEAALQNDCGKEYLERLNKLERENSELNKALALKLDAMPSGLSAGQSRVLEGQLKTAASLVRYTAYYHHPLVGAVFEYLDLEHRLAINEFLASVEGK